MEWLVFAIAEISFPGGQLCAEDAQAIEGLLSNYEDLDNISVDNKKITFYLWGQEEIDYGALDRIKDELKKRRFPNFVISATEYMGTGKKYYYVSKNLMQESSSLE